jgi:hypothetical protein
MAFEPPLACLGVGFVNALNRAERMFRCYEQFGRCQCSDKDNATVRFQTEGIRWRSVRIKGTPLSRSVDENESGDDVQPRIDSQSSTAPRQC